LKREEFASLLGLGGLIPFMGLALITTSPDPIRVEFAARGLTMYAASILTFVGALHWGVLLATPNHRLEKRGHMRYLWSVVPSLFAVACTMLPPNWALPSLALGLALAFAVDVPMYRKQGNLQWFLKLRTLLTVVAVLSIGFAWWNIRSK
jgi:Protein of unknown function (DUF3429)